MPWSHLSQPGTVPKKAVKSPSLQRQMATGMKLSGYFLQYGIQSQIHVVLKTLPSTFTGFKIFVMIIASYFFRPFSRDYIFQLTVLLNRLLIFGTLVFFMSLAACGGHQDQEHTVAMVEQQPEPLSTSSTVEPTVRASEGDYWARSISGDYVGYASLEQFIEEMVHKHGFSRDYLRGLFSQAHRKNWTLNYLAKSDQARKERSPVGGWTRYRAKFLDELHISKGIEFAQIHRTVLERASRQYNVPEEYILAILAVETRFGGNVGNHRVLDALTTLSFDYPRRSDFFRSELENFLIMTRNEGLDPAEPVGSYAGAMGLGQFMPSSFLQFAVDFNNDGRRDLWDPEDAIGSIANYLAQHGWEPGQPVVTPLTTRGTVALAAGISRQYTLSAIEQAGLQPVRPITTDGPFHLLLLHHASHDQYLIGHPNFYTITRYNHSVYYAMAVHELGQAIKRGYDIGSERYQGQSRLTKNNR